MSQNNTSSDKPTNAVGTSSRGTTASTAFRDAAAQSINHARNAYDHVRDAGQGAADVAHATGDSAHTHTLALTLKALDAVKTNTASSFEFFTQLISAKTAPEAIELQGTFAKRLFDTFSAQVKDLAEATQKAAIEIAKPAQAAWNNAAKQQLTRL